MPAEFGLMFLVAITFVMLVYQITYLVIDAFIWFIIKRGQNRDREE